MIRRNFLKVLALFGAKAVSSTSIDESKIQPIELNECYVVGLQYYDGENFNASTVKFLTLKREPTNEFDENAIEVFSDNLKIGYIPKRENKVIAKMLDQNITVVAKVTQYNPNDSYTHRIKVKLYQTQTNNIRNITTKKETLNQTQNDTKEHIEYNSLADESIEKILSFLPYFSEENKFAEWKGGEKEDGVITMPHLIYSDTVLEFLRTLYNTDFIVSFDWGKWDEGREIISNPILIQQSDLLTLRKLLTVVVRNDRFCEGALLSSIENGTVKEILLRLENISI